MKTEDIKKALNLNEEWKRTRKVKDDKGNIVREFYNNDTYYLFVVTDSTDTDIIYYDYLDLYTGSISTEDIKDSNRPWAKYIFAYGIFDYDEDTPWVLITPYIYWRDVHALYDQSIISRFLPKQLSEEMECSFCFYDDGSGATLESTIQQMKDSGVFVMDADFAKHMNFLSEAKNEHNSGFFCCSCGNLCELEIGDDEDCFSLGFVDNKFKIDWDCKAEPRDITKEDVDKILNMKFDEDEHFIFTCNNEEDEVFALIKYPDGTIDEKFDNGTRFFKKILSGEISLI